MEFYPALLVLHILSSVVWLGAFPAQLILNRFIKRAKGSASEKGLVSAYLVLINVTGMAGMTGILLTGIVLVLVLPYYSFFNFTADHWLVTKQILTVIIAVLVFGFIIPSGKKIRKLLNSEDESFSQEFYSGLSRLSAFSLVMNTLILINFLLAVTHRFLA